MMPDALDEACRLSDIRAVFVQPSVINPTATLMERSGAALAAVARKHDIAIIENDVLGPLVEDRPPPVAAFAPERTLYVTCFTKITVPGLRIGYLAAPDRYVAAVANRHLVSNWMATPMVAEIASKWVTDGTAMELVRWQRAALRRRQDDRCGDAGRASITAPVATAASVAAAARRPRRGKLRRPGAAAGRGDRAGHILPHLDAPWQPAVRISLGSTTEGELRAGLGVVAKLLLGDPEHLLLAI